MILTLPIEELNGFVDAAVMLREVVSRVSMRRKQAKARRKIRRALVGMWRQQQRLMVATWLGEIRRSGLLLEAASPEGLIHLLAMLMSRDESDWVDTLGDILGVTYFQVAMMRPWLTQDAGVHCK